MSERFYVNCPLQPGPVTIAGPELHHLLTVCRLRPGDRVCLFNGDGRQYPARLLEASRPGATLEVEAVEMPERELPFHLEVAVALPKGDRAQFLVEKLTELGVSRLVPLRTARSVVHPRETKLGKLQRWVIEASKQCGRNVLLQLGPLTDWASHAAGGELPKLRLLAQPAKEASAESSRVPLDVPVSPDAGVAVAVGPEGGFTAEEVALALHHGWRPLELGPRILRVETAAIAVAAVLSRCAWRGGGG